MENIANIAKNKTTNTTIRIRRVGSVTFGICLVGLGVLMLLGAIIPAFEATKALHFWPGILIILGVEVLLGGHYKSKEISAPDGQIIEQNKIVYDFAALLMMGFTILVTMSLAWLEWIYIHHSEWINW